MFFNDAFGFFGHYAFSSKPTHGRSIYESMSEGLGESYNSDFDSLQSARLYATAVCLASAQYQLDKALNNRDPSKATDLLPKLEEDFRVTPGPYDTLKQRRDFLSTMVKVSRGNSKQVIEAALFAILGDEFVSYSHLAPVAFPTNPEYFGVFSNRNEPVKQFFITKAVSVVGSPITVDYTVIPGSDLPMARETYTVDPDPRSTIETVTIDSVVGSSLTATFYRSHEPGTIATRPYPFWSSHGRYSTIVVKLSAAQNSEKRRKMNELMTRAARGVSQWAIVSDQGSFVLDSSTSGILGSTVLA
jgi:hypothetical protein